MKTVHEFHFSNGVPAGCIDWLSEHIGRGDHVSKIHRNTEEYKWWYDRVAIGSSEQAQWTPTIFIKNECDAIMFALRWS